MTGFITRFAPFGSMFIMLLAVGSVLYAEQDWSNYDWSQEEIELGAPGQTTDEAIEEAKRAVAASSMQVSTSAVGFDIPVDSSAEKYLQQVAAVGGGGYYRAEAGGELTRIMDDATAGRPPKGATPTTGRLQVGRSLQDGALQGAADHFPNAGEVWVHATFTDIPQNTTAQCVWLRNNQEVTRSERVIGGNGWVAFSISTTDKGGLQAGTYNVRLTAGGQLLGEKQFTIGQAAAAAPQPPPPAPAPAPAPQPQGGESMVLCSSYENNRPVGVGTRFHDIAQLLGVYTYKQRPAGDIEAIWYINGKEAARSRQTIQGGDGTAWFGIKSQEGRKLRPGTYRLELTIGGRPVASQEAVLTSSDAAG